MRRTRTVVSVEAVRVRLSRTLGGVVPSCAVAVMAIVNG
jgi:hypothetical protein